MHPKFDHASSLTGTVIAGAIEVHNEMGPGLNEPIYEWCLMQELSLRNLEITNQQKVLIRYKEFVREEPLRFDVLVEQCLLIDGRSLSTDASRSKCVTGPSPRLNLRFEPFASTPLCFLCSLL